MTRINSKALLALAALAAPLVSFGAFGNPGATPRFSPKFDKQTVCTNMVGRIEKWETTMQGKATKLQQIKTERQNRFEERTEKRDERIANRQGDNDKKWEEYFAKLEAKAQTDSQKQAVLGFKQAVMAAVETRRQAISAANEAFRNAVQSVINQRKASVEALATRFNAAVSAAIQAAKSDCAGGKDPVQVRETLRAAVKAARDAFQSGRQALDKAQVTLEAARTTHAAAIESAQAAFKTALEAARSAFKATIGTPIPIVSPSASPSPVAT